MTKDEALNEIRERIAKAELDSDGGDFYRGIKTGLLIALDFTSQIDNISNEYKPPLGLKPRYVHDAQRKEEIIEAMKRNASKPIPVEWVEELHEIVVREGAK